MRRPLFIIVVILIVVMAIVMGVDWQGAWNSESIDDGNKLIKNGEVVFVEISSEAGLNYIQSIREDNSDLDYLKDSMPRLFSGGAAVGDYDNDGFDDLFVTVLDGEDKLFRNLGYGKFIDVSNEVGLNLVIDSNKAEFFDFDKDKDLDLIVSTIEDRYYLFINDNGKFVDSGVVFDDNRHNGFGIAIGDYDNDRWLDVKTNDWNGYGSSEDSGYGKLFKNKRGEFIDVTVDEGVKMEIKQGYGDLSFDSKFSDLDNDGWLDLIVAADFGNSKMYWNENGEFVDLTEESGMGLDEFGMGVAVGDYDKDGKNDVFISSIYCDEEDCFEGMSGNKLYHNLGDRKFEEVSAETGVADGDWGWETEFFDYDLDGDLDLIMARGMKDKIMGEHDFASYAVKLWENDNGEFVDITEKVGLDIVGEGRDVVVFDFDNDKDLDIFVVRNGDSGLLFRNELIITTNPSS